MYEARQNKENMNRVIGGEDVNCNRQKIKNKKTVNHKCVTMQQLLRANNIIQNKPLQFVSFINKTYAGEISRWGFNQKSLVNSAINKGNSHLTLSQNETQDPIVQNCIALVIDAISDNDLKIYKLHTDGILALSVPNGLLEISLNITAHGDDEDEISKTLIHECFHIKCGGLTGVNEYSCTCDKDAAKRDIENKQNSSNINPDSFAQFVMKC